MFMARVLLILLLLTLTNFKMAIAFLDRAKSCTKGSGDDFFANLNLLNDFNNADNSTVENKTYAYLKNHSELSNNFCDPAKRLVCIGGQCDCDPLMARRLLTGECKGLYGAPCKYIVDKLNGEEIPIDEKSKDCFNVGGSRMFCQSRSAAWTDQKPTGFDEVPSENDWWAGLKQQICVCQEKDGNSRRQPLEDGTCPGGSGSGRTFGKFGGYALALLQVLLICY